MNDTELKQRLRRVVADDPPVPRLETVIQRGRRLAVRRAIGGLVATALAITAVAVPLSGLRHLGEAPGSSPTPASEPTFGDGRIGMAARDGWHDLQASDISVCTATVAISPDDVAAAHELGDEWLACDGTYRTLPAGAIEITVAVTSSAYGWEQPNERYPARTLPLQISDARTVPDPEGVPNNVLLSVLPSTIGSRWIDVRMYFGSEEPSQHQLDVAQERLNDLFVDAPASLGSNLAFAPDEGWNERVTDSTLATNPDDQATSAWAANVSLPDPDPNSIYPPGVTNNMIDALPADGVIVQANQILFTDNAIPPSTGYVPSALPLDLRAGTVSHGGWEGQTRTDLTQYQMRAIVNGRPVGITATFGTTDPSADLLREAQIELNRLVVVPQAAPTETLDRFGLSMTLPEGWHGLLYSWGDGSANLVASSVDAVDTDWETTRKALGPSDAAIVIEESQALVEVQGWAPLDGAVTIGPYNVCEGCELLDDGRPPAAGHALYLNTFSVGGRGFALYVEFGSTPTQAQLDGVDAILATLTFEPLADPTYTTAPGTTRVGRIYDGEDEPEVSVDDADRIMKWSYEHAAIDVPAGWTGQTYPVSGLERPMSLFAIGSWRFTPGGYCAPINALRELPPDGALVWIDGYGANPPDGVTFDPWPSTVDVSQMPTDGSACLAGGHAQVGYWAKGGKGFVVHVAFGSQASEATVAQADAALESFRVT
jgi:hypothetical protein